MSEDRADQHEQRFPPNTPEHRLNTLYGQILNRPIDEHGVTQYSQALHAGRSLTSVARELFGSDEFRNEIAKQAAHDRGQAIDTLYHRILGRDADEEGRRNYLNDQSLSIDAVTANMLDSDEFREKQRGVIRDELDSIYHNVLHRDIDNDGAERYVPEVELGRNLNDIRVEIINSDEFRGRLPERAQTDRRATVEALYERLLGRRIDDGGIKAYIEDTSLPINAVVDNILQSDEFKKKFPRPERHKDAEQGENGTVSPEQFITYLNGILENPKYPVIMNNIGADAFPGQQYVALAELYLALQKWGGDPMTDIAIYQVIDRNNPIDIIYEVRQGNRIYTIIQNGTETNAFLQTYHDEVRYDQTTLADMAQLQGTINGALRDGKPLPGPTPHEPDQYPDVSEATTVILHSDQTPREEIPPLPSGIRERILTAVRGGPYGFETIVDSYLDMGVITFDQILREPEVWDIVVDKLVKAVDTGSSYMFQSAINDFVDMGLGTEASLKSMVRARLAQRR